MSEQPIRVRPLTVVEQGRLRYAIRLRGGMPRLLSQRQRRRRTESLVREVKWQLARYAELLAWCPSMADLVHTGQMAIWDAVIMFRLKLQLYDDNVVESIADQWYRDPQAPLKYLESDWKPEEFAPEIQQEVQLIIERVKSASA